MSLNSLTLYSNVKITRDYSIVQDMDPETWYGYLSGLLDPATDDGAARASDPSPPVIVYDNQTVNYYRLPDVIRIESNYDNVRKATYGCLVNNDDSATPSFKYIFFWVDAVRLIKQCATTVEDLGLVKDVVELDVTIDVWSTNQGRFGLYDSHVVRRHKDRWVWIGLPIRYYQLTDSIMTYEGDPVQGDYLDKIPEKLIAYASADDHEWDMRAMVVCSVGSNGGVSYNIGVWAVDPTDEKIIPVYIKYDSDPTHYGRLMNLQDIRNGYIPTVTGKTVGDIQSILVIAPTKTIIEGVTSSYDNGDDVCPYIDASVNTDFWKVFGAPATYIGGSAHRPENAEACFLSMVQDVNAVRKGIQEPSTVTLADFGDTGPDYSPKLNGSMRPDATWVHQPDYEPMMFRSPAQIRQVVNKLGTVIFKVPDSVTLQKKYTVNNVIDVNSGAIMVYGGTNPLYANGQGNIGAMSCPSLPITESAWKNYQAIQKTGDDIVYNAKQTTAIISTITGAAGGAAAGALATGGNPAGAAVGVAGGVVRGVAGYWSNSEELRARRTVIRNSPGIVKSGSDGMGGAFEDYYGLMLQTLVINGVQYTKMDKQYFFFGYNVDEYTPGEIPLTTRINFDYIETRRANIRGEIGSDVCSAIADIFDRGVRIYHGAGGYTHIGDEWTNIKENWEISLLED